MGTGLRCLVASLAFLSLAGHSLALAAGVSCQNNNPFIQIMAKQGIKLYPEPKKVDTICRSEFAEYGTCCDVSRLESYAQRDTNAILSTHNRLVKEYGKLVWMSRQLVSLILKVSKIKVDGNGPKGILKRVKAAIALKKTKSFRYLASSFGRTTAVDLKTFASENKRCWMRLADERSASICATCSGRSDHFFLNGKILISQAKCEQLTEVCSEPVDRITRIVIGIQALASVQTKIADAGIRADLGKQKISKMMSALASVFSKVFSDITSVTQLLLAPPSAEFEEESATSESESLCSKFVRIREPVMLMSMENILNKVSAIRFKMDTRLNSYLRRRAALSRLHSATAARKNSRAATQARGSWRAGGRVLQFSKSPQNLGSDAKIVSPTDPSYTSVGVSGHGPLPDNSSFP